MTSRTRVTKRGAALLAFACVSVVSRFADAQSQPAVGLLLTGDAAMGDFRGDAPGVRRKLTPSDLPKPNATPSVRNKARVVPPPKGALPQVPAGFRVAG